MDNRRPYSLCLRILLVSTAVFLTTGAASAKAGYLSAEQYPAPLSGTQVYGPSIYTNGGTFRCSSSTYTGSLPYESSTFTLKPTFSNCTFAGFTASINPEGCTYEYYIGWNLGGGNIEITWSSSMYIRCPKDQSIKFEALTCAMEIKPQGSVDPVYLRAYRGQDYWESTYPSYPYLDHVTPGDIRVEHDISNLTYTVTKDGTFCPFPSTGTFGYGDYESVHTLVAGNARGNLRIN